MLLLLLEILVITVIIVAVIRVILCLILTIYLKLIQGFLKHLSWLDYLVCIFQVAIFNCADWMLLYCVKDGKNFLL